MENITVDEYLKIKKEREELDKKLKELKHTLNISNDSTCIKSARIARKLLKKGHKIIDIKPDKNDPQHKRSVFVFESVTEKFFKDFEEIKKSIEVEKTTSYSPSYEKSNYSTPSCLSAER